MGFWICLLRSAMIPSSLQIPQKPQRLLDRVALGIATGGYSGYIRIVPATIGSAAGLFLYLPLATAPAPVQLTLTGALLALGIWASDRAERIIRTKDSRLIVIDEIVGMWVAVQVLPYQLNYLLFAFLLFRAFDILKPFPAEQAQRLRGGLGIMLDDLIAGIYTNAVLHGVDYFAALSGAPAVVRVN